VLKCAKPLTPDARERAVQYARSQLRTELGFEVTVHPVSTVGADESLLTAWFDREIEPLLGRHRALAELSLRRKTAQLREAVVAVLQTLSSGPSPSGGTRPPGADIAGVRHKLEEAEAAMQEARVRCRDWVAHAPALVESALQSAAEGVVARDGQAGNDHGLAAVLAAIRRVLAERDTAALAVLTELQKQLLAVLETLRHFMPQAPSELIALQTLAFRSLPAVYVEALRSQVRASRPWWSGLWPKAAVAWTRRRLRTSLGAALEECLGLHDRQLQIWLKSCLAQLVERYETQAEVYRELLGRLGDRGGTGRVEADRAGVEEDLRKLQAGNGDTA
jgi:hypothetical protein